MTEKTRTPLAAKLIGFAGVALFLFTAINLHTKGPLFTGFALQVFVVFSALILSFLGGIRWGLALQGTVKNTALFIAVLPNVLALGALLLNQPLHQVVMLMVGFVGMLLLDWFAAPLHMPQWMVMLRLQLGLLVIIAHVIALVAVGQWT